MSRSLDKLKIEGSHEQVMRHWADVRRRLSAPPVLVSFDAHADHHIAFDRYVAKTHKRVSQEGALQLMNELVSDVDFNRPETVESAIQKLRHDEHIDCALGAGVLSEAHVIRRAYDERVDEPPEYGQHQHFSEWGDGGAVDAMEEVDRQRVHARGLLESSNLAPLVSEIEEIVGSPLAEVPYILDIDLDFFPTCAALEPKDPQVFNDLVSGSLAITVAREPEYSAYLWIGETPFDNDHTLSSLREKIGHAQGSA